MRKILLLVTIFGSLSLFAAQQIDLALDASAVLEFQSAVAKYDEEKAMSFIAQNAVLIFNEGLANEKRFLGRDEIRRAYKANWFNVPSRMLTLDEANFSHTAGGEFLYSFKGSFLIDNGDGWKEFSRQSDCYFTISDGMIVKIRRFQGC